MLVFHMICKAMSTHEDVQILTFACQVFVWVGVLMISKVHCITEMVLAATSPLGLWNGLGLTSTFFALGLDFGCLVLCCLVCSLLCHQFC